MSEHSARSAPLRFSVPAVAGAAVPATSLAQIEEVVVTARKRSENLQGVPMVVTTISAEAIERKGITDLGDVANYSSGVMLDQGFNRQDTRVVIRGLSPTRGRQSVAILQDDVDISSLAQATAGGSFVINPRLMDVERIEVVKGPHSALYGRSAFNGAINYVARRPGDEFRASAQVGIASFDEQEAKFSLSGPVDGLGRPGQEARRRQLDQRHPEPRGEHLRARGDVGLRDRRLDELARQPAAARRRR